MIAAGYIAKSKISGPTATAQLVIGGRYARSDTEYGIQNRWPLAALDRWPLYTVSIAHEFSAGGFLVATISRWPL